MRLLTLLLVLIALYGTAFGGGLMAAPEDISGLSPRQCQECHADEYRQWVRSDHNRSAYRGQVFRAAWQRAKQSPECLSCHATGYDAAAGGIEERGVACFSCHAPVNNPRGDQSSREHVRLSIPEKSADCATCHGADHALTYPEWKLSRHNGTREIRCQDCHDSHTARLVMEDVTALCMSCHAQPVPTTNPHMGDESNCTDCHPAPIATDNVHMSDAVGVSCTDCHMVMQRDERGLYLTSAGHQTDVSLTACTTCHGDLHTLQPRARHP